MVLNYQKILNFNNIIKITFFCLIEFYKLKKKKRSCKIMIFTKRSIPLIMEKKYSGG